MESESKRDAFHLLIHSPVSFNGQGWARSKPGTRAFFWVSQMGSRDPNSWAIFHYFPRLSVGSWIGSGAAETQHPNGMWCYKQQLNLLSHSAGISLPGFSYSFEKSWGGSVWGWSWGGRFSIISLSGLAKGSIGNFVVLGWGVQHKTTLRQKCG